MAKNSIFDPTKDGVKADNSGYSSNQIDKMIGQSAAALIDDDASGDDTVYSSAKIYSMLPEGTATGASVTITDACSDLPIVELQADINAVQEGTGDPSPDNVRPITGWDEITVTHDSIDVEISLGDDTIYGGIYNSDGTLTITHISIDLGSLTWSIHNNIAGRFTASLTDTAKGSGSFAVTSGEMCSIYKTITVNSLFSNNTGIAIQATNGGSVFIYDSTQTSATADEFKETVSGAQLVYELATPTTLTVGTLAFNTNGEGPTVISCDSGDVTVTYKKLTTLS